MIKRSIVLLSVILMGLQSYALVHTNPVSSKLVTASPTPTVSIQPTINPVATPTLSNRVAASPTKSVKRSISNVSRGDTDRVEGRKKLMELTAYTAYNCDKSENDPAFGVTASGKKVKEWRTIASGKCFPFGTRVYIPYFKDYPNQGIFVVEDRGGAIDNDNLDIYMSSLSEAKKFGRQTLEVYILN